MPDHAEELLELLESDDIAARTSTVTRLVRKIIIHATRIIIHLKEGENLSIDYIFSKPGRYRRMVTADQPSITPKGQKQALLKAYLQGYIWRRQFFEIPGTTIAGISSLEDTVESYVTRPIHCSLMAPDFVARILKSDIATHVNRTNFNMSLPVSLPEQGQRFEQTG